MFKPFTMRQWLILQWFWFKRFPGFICLWVQWRKEFMEEMKAEIKKDRGGEG